MPIVVTCPGCQSRFKVGDQHAGKKGPCPKCKAVIQVPAAGAAEVEVKIHEPQSFGPKNTQGRATLQPIFRPESKAWPQIVGAAAGAVAFVLLLTFLLRLGIGPGRAHWLLLALGALISAAPVAWLGYEMLRSDDLEPHEGQSLWTRVGLCGALYAGLWGLAWLAQWLIWDSAPFDFTGLLVIVPGMLALGGGVALACFEFDFWIGVAHCSMYLLLTMTLRLILGFPAFG